MSAVGFSKSAVAWTLKAREILAVSTIAVSVSLM
jgi:hypothetical protein